MSTRPILLALTLFALSALLGCTDAGVEPGISTLPTPSSVTEAQRLIVGRWRLTELWVNGTKHVPITVEEMTFSSDGVARTYSDGQLTKVERYSFLDHGREYLLDLKSSGLKSLFCIAGNYFSWNSMMWDGDARLYVRTIPAE